MFDSAAAHTCRLCGGHLVQSVNTYVHADTLDEDCPSQKAATGPRRVSPDGAAFLAALDDLGPDGDCTPAEAAAAVKAVRAEHTSEQGLTSASRTVTAKCRTPRVEPCHARMHE